MGLALLLSLTKDDYKRFRECYKLFWVYKDKRHQTAFETLCQQQKVQIQQKKPFADLIDNNNFHVETFWHATKPNNAKLPLQLAKLAELDPSKVIDGKTVGEYAKQYYYDQDRYECYDFSALKSRQYATTVAILANQEYNLFFEPTFQYENFMMRADILIRDQHDPNAFHLVEVKAKTCFQKDLKNADFKMKTVPRELLYDVAYQYFILRSLNITIRSVALLMLDNRIIHQATVDWEKLFFLVTSYQNDSLLQYCQNEFSPTKFFLNSLSEAYQLDVDRCGEAHDLTNHEMIFTRTTCYNHTDRYQFCPHITAYISSEDNVYFLYRGLRLANTLYYRYQYHHLTAVDPWQTYEVDDKPKILTDQQKRQIIVTKNKQPLVDSAAQSQLLEMLQFYQEHFPLYMYDFEAAKTAIPLFEYMKVYQDIPFQYSVHVLMQWDDLDQRDEALIHHGYLHDGLSDPRLAVIKHLTKDLFAYGRGFYVAYYQSYEKRMLTSLIDYLTYLQTAPLECSYFSSVSKVAKATALYSRPSFRFNGFLHSL